MSIQDMSHNTPLATVSLDTFALMAAVIFTTGKYNYGDSVHIASDLIGVVQRFDWDAHRKEMNLPKGEQ